MVSLKQRPRRRRSVGGEGWCSEKCTYGHGGREASRGESVHFVDRYLTMVMVIRKA